jgi:hypothetical protein
MQSPNLHETAEATWMETPSAATGSGPQRFASSATTRHRDNGVRECGY